MHGGVSAHGATLSSMTGITKPGICAILSGMVHMKEPLLLLKKSSPCSGGSVFFSVCMSYVI